MKPSFNSVKALLILVPSITLLATACDSKQTIKSEPNFVAQNQATISSPTSAALNVVSSPTTPAILGANATIPVKVAKPVQPKATKHTSDNSAALQQAQQEADNARLAQQQAEARSAQLQAEQKAAQDALDAATKKAQADAGAKAAADAAASQAAEQQAQAQAAAQQQQANLAAQAQIRYQNQYQAVQAKIQPLKNQADALMAISLSQECSGLALGQTGIKCQLAANQAADVGEYETAILNDFLTPVTDASVAYENKLDDLFQQIFQVKMAYHQQVANIDGNGWIDQALANGQKQNAFTAANAKISAINQQIQFTLQDYQNGVAP